MSKLYILTGPSGAGKTMIMNALMGITKFPGRPKVVPGLKRLPTATTRRPRSDDEAGAYYYLSKESFRSMQMYAPNSYSGYLYGIPAKIADDLLNSENDVITVLDTTGAKEMKETLGNQVCVIFIHAPLKAIESRLTERGDKDKDKRLALAEAELQFSYESDIVVHNTSRPQEAIDQVREIIRAHQMMKNTVICRSRDYDPKTGDCLSECCVNTKNNSQSDWQCCALCPDDSCTNRCKNIVTYVYGRR